MKVALCLHGLVGSIKGKNSEMAGGGDDVLRLSYGHNQHIIDINNADVFVHSWSTEFKDKINALYAPKSSLIEEQIQFELPDYIKSKPSRVFAHLSRWYSYKKVVELLRTYEEQNNIKYDYVLVQRFDLVWNAIPEFDLMNVNNLYVGKSTLNSNTEWSDRWFIANSDNMEKFATLYDNIYEYMKPGGELPSNKQYGGISSHYLTRFHAKKLGLTEEFMYNFGGYKQQPNDYNEVRRQYYGNDN